MPLVIELQESRRIGVLFFEVDVVNLGFFRCVTTILANIYLRSSLLIFVAMSDPMHLEAVALQRAALCERFLTQVTLVRPNSCTKVISY